MNIELPEDLGGVEEMGVIDNPKQRLLAIQNHIFPPLLESAGGGIIGGTPTS